MKLSIEMQEKLAFMAAGLHLRNRDEPKPKPRTLYLARLQIRTDNVSGGGAVPDDEVQIDFTISSGGRDAHGSYMTPKTLANYSDEAARGVPFMLDHASGMDQQIGRTVAANYDETEKRVVATISMLRDTDATPENMRVGEYIRRIERKYYDSCSVGIETRRKSVAWTAKRYGLGT